MGWGFLGPPYTFWLNCTTSFHLAGEGLWSCDEKSRLLDAIKKQRNSWRVLCHMLGSSASLGWGIRYVQDLSPQWSSPINKLGPLSGSHRTLSHFPYVPRISAPSLLCMLSSCFCHHIQTYSRVFGGQGIPIFYDLQAPLNKASRPSPCLLGHLVPFLSSGICHTLKCLITNVWFYIYFKNCTSKEHQVQHGALLPQ